MFLVDMLISIILKNNILFLKFFKKINILSILFLCLFFLSNQNKLEANELYNNLYLAYIKTEEQLLNKIALSGLNELRTYLVERTSLSPQGVKEIDLFEDDLFFYPLIYWQISNSLPELNDKL